MSVTLQLLRRLATLVVSLLGSSLAVFLLLNALPGDVTAAILGTNADPAAIAQLRERMGLDEPVLVRYLQWLVGLLHGDLGHSLLTGDPVASLVGPRFGVTLSLVVVGMTLSVLIAVPLGMVAAVYRRDTRGFLASTLGQVGMAVPAFLAGILLVLLFAVKLRWLPASGYVDIQRSPLEWARHLVLPSLSLALVNAALLSRYVRSSFIEVLEEDWFRTARSVGWRLWPALWRHGVRNAATSFLTVLGLQLATVFVGAVVIEQVFALPGLGTLLLDEVAKRDLVVVQAVVMLMVGVVLTVNAIVDALALVLDPRLRQGGDAR